jgi:hypothetical protein
MVTDRYMRPPGQMNVSGVWTRYQIRVKVDTLQMNQKVVVFERGKRAVSLDVGRE